MSEIHQKVYDYTTTPYPAWLFSSLLLATPVVSPATPTLNPNASKGLLFKSPLTTKIGPTNKNVLFFSGVSALGGWMIYDGDVESGSGFLAAWSTLYVLVNGKSSLSALRYGKVWPLGLATAATAQGFLYSERFFYGKFEP